MPRDVLPLRPAARDRHPGFAALAGLRRLRDALPAATCFRDACRAADRWGEPPLFFAHESHAAAKSSAIERFGVAVARRMPDDAAAWAAVAEQSSELAERAAESIAVRRVARAIPELLPKLADLAPDHAGCHTLADVLAVADDTLVNVIFPAERRGWRVVASGVADVDALHALLLDEFTADPPTTARWQAFRPSAVRPDGSLPTGPRGAAHWVWGHQPLSDIAQVDGVPVVLFGPAAYPRPLPARRFDQMRPTLDVLGPIPTAEMARLYGTAPVRRRAA